MAYSGYPIPIRERIAHLDAGKGYLEPNKRRYHARCPDYTGYARLPGEMGVGGMVVQLGGWVRKPWHGMPVVDVKVEWAREGLQVPYDPDYVGKRVTAADRVEYRKRREKEERERHGGGG